VSIKFAYFGRESDAQIRPCITTDWITDTHDMRDMMHRARKRCICGCYVHVDDILEQALREAQQGPVQAVIILGDYFHGDVNAALTLAKKLRAAVTRLFVFQPEEINRTHGISGSVEQFSVLTETTGGAFIQFNPYVEVIAEQLPTTLQALARYAVGGIEALKQQATQHDNNAAVLLLEQMTALPFSLEFEDQLVPEEVKRGQ
jgi:hypothetical protein